MDRMGRSGAEAQRWIHGLVFTGPCNGRGSLGTLARFSRKERELRAVIQRVAEASVVVDGRETGTIGRGLLVLLGVEQDDTEADAAYLAEKTVGLRIFADTASKFNLSLEDTGGAVLVVSQFTLHGDCRKGRRPSFSRAARPELAIPLYEHYVGLIRKRGFEVATGEFGAHMDVRLVNDGPVTLLLDSRKLF